VARRPLRTRAAAGPHPATAGFDRAARAYERGRPEYPPAAVEELRRRLGLRRGTTVVDLGSGTGKLTRTLARTGAARVAIEPQAGMREVFEEVIPEVPVLEGTAEGIPLPDRFCDAAVAGQAFHWFDARRALPEIARILRPDGTLGLLWNIRDESPAWCRRLTEIIDGFKEAHEIPRTRDRGWKFAFEGPACPFGPLEHRTFPFVHASARAAVVDRFLSVSVIAIQRPEVRRATAERIRAILDEDPATRDRARIRVPYRTELYWTHLCSRSSEGPNLRVAGRARRTR
jgi:SAM-dependent methyltransferase